jgi:hypothetical protein
VATAFAKASGCFRACLACGSFLEVPSLFLTPILWFFIFYGPPEVHSAGPILEVFYAHPHAPGICSHTQSRHRRPLNHHVLSLIAATIATYQRQQPPVQKINYSQLYGFAEAGGAVALSVEGETLTVTKADGSLVEATVTGESTQHEVVQLFRKNNVPVEFRPLQPGLAVQCRSSWGCRF